MASKNIVVVKTVVNAFIDRLKTLINTIVIAIIGVAPKSPAVSIHKDEQYCSSK